MAPLTNYIRSRSLSYLIFNYIDIETPFYASLLVVLSRILCSTNTDPFILLIPSVATIIVVLLIGAKVASWIKGIVPEISRPVFLGLVPIFGTGFVYLSWMTIANFSHLAPIITLFLGFLCLITPPCFHITTFLKVEGHHLFNEFKNQKKIMLSFIVQLVLMTYVSYALRGADSGIWLNSIFHGVSIWVPFSVLMVIVLLIANITHSRESRVILISIVVIVIWLRSFMLLRGFIHFGGDDGDHIAVIKFLLNGGRTPFLDLSVIEGGFNWRYGSRLTLFFHSNMAFLSALGGLPIDLPGAISVSLSIMLLSIGGYALASSVLKNERAIQLCLVLMLFNFPDFFWQFRFDPTNIFHVLLPAYLAIVIGISFSIKELILYFISSVAFFVTHPMSIGLILPIASYKIYNYSHLLIQKNRNKFILSFSIGLVIILSTFLYSSTLFLILRAFSVTHLVGLTETSMPIQIGNFISESYLFDVSLKRYILYISFLFALGLALLFSPWNEIKDHIFWLKMRELIVFFVLVMVETIFIDFFLRAAAFPYERLFPLVLTIYIPIVSAVFSFLED